MDTNLVIMTGRLTADPEIRYVGDGIAVTKFSIASNGRKQGEVEFTDVVVWRKLAENCNTYLSKGSKVQIQGRKQTRSYDDKNGNKRRVTEVVAEQVQFLGSKSRTQAPVEEPEIAFN